MHRQYARWLGGVLRGDLGRSLFSRQPVLGDLLERVPVSLQLALSATLVSVLIAIPAGVLAASRRNLSTETLFAAVTMTGICIPAFVMGLLLMLVLSAWLGWFPIRGYQPLSDGVLVWARYMVLPAIAYGTIQAAGIARMTRATLLEVLSEDFIRTARAKGLAGSVVSRRGARADDPWDEPLGRWAKRCAGSEAAGGQDVTSTPGARGQPSRASASALRRSTSAMARARSRITCARR